MATSQCTSIGSADASISRRVECKATCNQGNVLESATRTQKTAYFSMAFAQERAEKYKNIIFRGRSGTLAKSREGQQLLAGGVTEDQRHPTHNPRSLPVCVLAGHSLSAAVDIIPGRGWHHARAEKL